MRNTTWNLRGLKNAFYKNPDVRRQLLRILPINQTNRFVEKYQFEEEDVKTFNDHVRKTRA